MKKTIYFKIIITVMAGSLLQCAPVFAQQGTVKTVVLDSHRCQRAGNVATDAAYNVVVARRFIDSDGGSDRWFDPSGLSEIDHLVIDDGIILDDSNLGSTVIAGTTGNASINFSDLAFGDTRLGNVLATRFIMHDDGPGNYRGEGKLIYDIAESIEVEDAEACEVVVISKNKDLAVTRSTTRFDTRVAGVISEEPKLVMGDNPEYKPLALAGIVRCNVNTENGPVKKGDILVSSSEPGYAMRASSDEVLPGMIIGSALDSLAQGKGKIYILVNQ